MTAHDDAAESPAFAAMNHEPFTAARALHVAADVVLIQRLARGDRRALESFYERHGGLALALAQRALGDRDLAEDAVQEAFVALWRHAGEFDATRCAPRTWLLSIVRNRCIDELRKRSSLERRTSLLTAQPPAIGDDPWPETWKRTCKAAITRALAELPSEQREVVELGFYRGLSHAQIADAIGAPLGTVKKRMRSGLKRLRDLLGASYAETSAP
jgi:RNA polymerase sigma-70 factor (ECF subfamily)